MLYQKKSTCFASTVLFTVTMTTVIKQGQCQHGKGEEENVEEAEKAEKARVSLLVTRKSKWREYELDS
ncbi:hypothetical protein C0W35_03120 [Photobacterium kishitanii]|nr:hypothetical protein C0W35_03120 [Photobacterium kishitanii]